MPIRGRSAYNPIASVDTDDVEAAMDVPVLPVEETGTGRTNGYSRVSSTTTTAATASLVDSIPDDDEEEEEEDVKTTTTTANEHEGMITVIILDSAQKRFKVQVHPDWTVEKFKQVGAQVHKVPPPSQRLIVRGKMLQDSKSLRDMGIVQDDIIVHLFPKPRVIFTSSSYNSTTTETASVTSSIQDNHHNNNHNGNSNNSNDEEEGGAHIPQIVLDEDEQERRGQILVLGSYEIAEAQNNVRLLSLLLGTICFLRLLSLMSIATGADVDDYPPTPDSMFNQTDDAFSPSHGGGSGSSDDGLEPRTWESQDYLDLLVSTIGLFVARLGMMAAQENTSRLASRYLVGTIFAGLLWNFWNFLEFVLFVKDESSNKTTNSSDDAPLTNDDFRSIALFTVFLPLGVWVICCARAWQFRELITEAENEAAERIRNEIALQEGDTEAAVDRTTNDEDSDGLDDDEEEEEEDRRTIV